MGEKGSIGEEVREPVRIPLGGGFYIGEKKKNRGRNVFVQDTETVKCEVYYHQFKINKSLGKETIILYK